MSSAAHELEIYSTEPGLTAKQLLAFWKKGQAGPSVLPSNLGHCPGNHRSPSMRRTGRPRLCNRPTEVRQQRDLVG